MYSIKYIPIVEVIRKAGIITIKNKRIFILNFSADYFFLMDYD